MYQGCANGDASHPPNTFKFARKLVKKVSQAAKGLATVFSVTCCFSNNILTIVGQDAPSQQKVSRHITAILGGNKKGNETVP